MASSSGRELISAAQYSAVQHQLVDVTAERDRLARERDQLAHERDELKDRADWLFKQLERLRYDAKTPRERVDPRQIFNTRQKWSTLEAVLLSKNGPPPRGQIGGAPTQPAAAAGAGRVKGVAAKRAA